MLVQIATVKMGQPTGVSQRNKRPESQLSQQNHTRIVGTTIAEHANEKCTSIPRQGLFYSLRKLGEKIMVSISMLIASIVLGGAMMVNSFQGPGGAKPRQKPVIEETPKDNDPEVIVGEVSPDLGKK
jgi:hypothetical protein